MRASIITLALVTAVSGHYTFPKISGTNDWQYVRRTANWQSNGPVQDVNSQAIRCFEAGGRSSASTYGVQAGGSLTFQSAPNIFHPGPVSGWMAKVPAGQTAASWDGSGQAWFKVYQEMPTGSNGGLQFASNNKASASFTIPRCIENGEYLFRIEHNALHGASSVGGAQFYISCAQINVSGGSGSKKPSNLVSFPGAYKATDPGILVNMYNARSYTPAGPAVFTC
ncbi:hypothetical protein GGTG_09799 [Gaeumannomyces tritici R3-111a-1]|uniref:lytic cellulose monooxygenase (C4-dehydrogenating) n=1 Tax=Gaeumannomyces tritici (strain R3-111a-1) TaxID=644352 RepID=J3P8G5_GAET3|nr:hypothetical protein GGTG_09799 [Gaeumannomyces tritici R3-111a-1]EJT72948.1 hypothetical protein GGTG_09799 [Gaeumannomyces tritici R3-111a-1]